jgi:purine-nucleoside/S-methyl-5'-thioadenosine phosphorylase / adenosine deaminase
MEWRESKGVRWLEADLGGAKAAFSTRVGGVSESPFDSLNLGILTEDSREAVEENRRRLAAVLGRRPDQIRFALQVHGTRLLDQEEPVDEMPEADGHVLRNPNAAAFVFVADCLPVALSGPRGVAMVHAGWRGLAGGILGTAAEAVGAETAAVGPGIGRCCYEVGEEVLESFESLGDGIAEGRMLDLPEVARRLLERAGVERIDLSGLCTSCEEELFFSHRRDNGKTGRQAGVAWLEDEL